MNEKGEYKAADGSTFREEDIERWAAEAEAGFPGWKFGKIVEGPPVIGRPVEVGEDVRPVTFRLDEVRRSKIKAEARKRNVTVSRLMRDLIDAL